MLPVLLHLILVTSNRDLFTVTTYLIFQNFTHLKRVLFRSPWNQKKYFFQFFSGGRCSLLRQLIIKALELIIDSINKLHLFKCVKSSLFKYLQEETFYKYTSLQFKMLHYFNFRILNTCEISNREQSQIFCVD